MSDAFGAFLERRPARRDRPPATARVVKSTSQGVWVALLDDDTRHPIGPCRGLPASKGEIVLVVFTQERPWVTAVDGGWTLERYPHSHPHSH